MNPIMLHTFPSKAEQIMSKYRPIAPKPPSSKTFSTLTSTSPPPSILQRSNRTRKRSRPAHLSLTLAPPSFKRSVTSTKSLLDSKCTIPEEKDLLCQLQDTDNTLNVLAPQPLRPIGSTITIFDLCSREENYEYCGDEFERRKTVSRLEKEVELEKLPMVISDRNDKVKVSNSAYKVLVGQPECTWLGLGGGRGFSARIAGEVMLRNGNLKMTEEMEAKGFLCMARIEWGDHGNEKRKWMNAVCEASRVWCESDDYVFAWRFLTKANRNSPREHSS